jgi:hypothetical protein
MDKTADQIIDLRRIELDYQRSHFEMESEITEKKALASWKLCARNDIWTLNRKLKAHVDLSINILNLMDSEKSKTGEALNLGHSFLKEWRNLNHHKQSVLFEPFTVQVRRKGHQSLNRGPDFFLNLVAQEIKGAKRKKKSSKSGRQNDSDLLDCLDKITGDGQKIHLCTLSGALNENHDYIKSKINSTREKVDNELRSRRIAISPMEYKTLQIGSDISSSVELDSLWRSK